MFELQLTDESKSQIEAILTNPSKKGLAKQLKKALKLLANNPKHPGLRTHAMKGSFSHLGRKVFTSYVQNNTPGAHRILWTYQENEPPLILIIEVIPHY